MPSSSSTRWWNVWNDVVDEASRMESLGLPGQIQLTRERCKVIKDEFRFEGRGCLEVKGFGPMDAWWLRGRRE